MSDPNLNNLTIAGLLQILSVPFASWSCPKGCRVRVLWYTDGTDAKCLECGTWRSDGVGRVADNPKAAPEAAHP